ncbi:putative virion structural protein [Erwinia phage pEa_SNUABM_42]|nr:putative virion structural protein [Erwinia phage pEa_SNUABM_43]QVW55474.1 putative virion structural protein [Erwinia phage pEa_SNUABM_42]
MAFILRWTNPNKLATTVNIYRDTKALVSGALPAPIATLTGGETQWRDTTALKGGTYYYLLAVTANGKTVYGAQQSYTIEVKRGIGPNTLLWGTDEYGYYGLVPYAEQMDQSQFPAAFNAINTTAFTDRIPMMKYAYRGKILYLIDRTPLYPADVPWNTLYTGGLIYGVDGPGPDGCWGDSQPTDQGGKILHNTDTYRLRVPRGFQTYDQPLMFPFDNTLDKVNHDKLATQPAYNEFNDLIYTQVLGFPANRRAPCNRPNTSLNLGSIAYPTGNVAFNGGVACQERDTLTKRAMARGWFTATTKETVLDAMQKVNYVAPTQGCRYIPIIELQE